MLAVFLGLDWPDEVTNVARGLAWGEARVCFRQSSQFGDCRVPIRSTVGVRERCAKGENTVDKIVKFFRRMDRS